MCKALLLVLAITWLLGCASRRVQFAWPPRVGVSTANKCEVAYCQQASGHCDQVKEIEPGKSYWWRAYGIIEWAGRGWDPKQVDIWSGESRNKAIDECKVYLKAYERVRKVKPE